MNKIALTPIGEVRHGAAPAQVPRHWTVSDLEGQIVLHPEFVPGLRDVEKGDRVIVLFYFDQSPPFRKEMLIQKPPHKDKALGVFSTCSPRRPNPIGLSVVQVLAVDRESGTLRVKGLDMFDKTPVLDIKPVWKEDATGA